MTRLMLLRHARAGWPGAGSCDFDRSLTESGHKDARAVAEVMRRAGYVPDLAICSTARRARETWDAVADVLGADDLSVRHDVSLYNSDVLAYLRLVQEAPAVASLLLIGHNPMMEDLALALAKNGNAERMAALRRGLPTAGLAVLSFTTPLSGIGPESGTLEALLAPGPLGNLG